METIYVVKPFMYIVAFMKKALKRILLVAASTYVTLFCANFIIYNAGYTLTSRSTSLRDLLYSNGVIRRENHPLYRTDFHGFLPPQAAITSSISRTTGDVYGTLGISFTPEQQSPSTPMIWPSADKLGWINTNDLKDCQVLFIGDSFTRGNGAGFYDSIPSHFQNITGLRTYVAANEGYGPQQYMDIIATLLKEWNTAIPNKTVYVMLCLENDFSYDYLRYIELTSDERATSRLLFKASWYIRLQALRRWQKLLHSHARSIPKSSNQTNDPTTAAPSITQCGGWYPVYMNLPNYTNTPFAFFRGNYEAFMETGWFNERKDEIAQIFKSLHSIAHKNDLRIRFVLIPATLQLMSPYIIESECHSEFSENRCRIVENMNDIATKLSNMVSKAQCELLMLEPGLSEVLGKTDIVWPGDIHFTSAGYKAIAQQIADKWHNSP